MKRKIFAFAALALAFAVAAPTFADDGEGTLEVEATLGANAYHHESNPDSAKFEEYREVPSGVLLEHFMLHWRPRDRWFVEVEAHDAAQKDQSGAFVFGVDKYWKGYFTWRENPRRFMDRAVSPYASSGGVFTLPDSLQAAIQAAAAGSSGTAGTKSFLLKDALVNAPEVNVGYQRRTANAGLEATPSAHWIFRLDAERERRGGAMGQAMLYNSSPSGVLAEAAAPVDFRTDTFAGSVEFVRDRFSAGASLILSDFSNEYTALIFDNPTRSTDATGSNNASRGRMAGYPDNEYQQFRLHASANLPWWATRLFASASFAETKQDDAFLPFTINSAFTATRDLNGDGVVDADDTPTLVSALPRASLRGKYETNTFSFRAPSRPSDWLRLKGWWNRYERDDQSGRFLLGAGYVSGDANYSGTCSAAVAALGGCSPSGDPIQRLRLPYDYEKTNAGLEARFGHFGPLAFGAGFERQTIEREHAGVVKSAEDIFKLTADLDATEWLFLRAAFRTQDRKAKDHDGHRYDGHYYEEAFPIGEPLAAAFNEGMRRFYWTDRDRDVYSLLVDVTPFRSEKVSFYGEASYSKNTYSDPETGQGIGGSYYKHVSPYCEGLADDPTRLLAGCNPADLTQENILLAGRVRDNGRSYTVGAAFAPTERFDAYADFTWETFEYAMISRLRGVVANTYGIDDVRNNWGADVRDKHQTWGLGFNAALVKDKTRLNGSLSHTTGKGTIENWYHPGYAALNSSVPAFTEPYPTLKDRLTVAMLALDHSVRKNLAFGARWWFEKWKSDDFAQDDMAPYMGDDTQDTGARLWMLLGGNMNDYEVHMAQFFVRISM